jgi:hypothetical protein
MLSVDNALLLLSLNMAANPTVEGQLKFINLGGKD